MSWPCAVDASTLKANGLMKSLLKFVLLSIALLGCGLSVGCGGHGGEVQETEKMSFDDMAEMAAKETELNEQSTE